MTGHAENGHGEKPSASPVRTSILARHQAWQLPRHAALR